MCDAFCLEFTHEIMADEASHDEWMTEHGYNETTPHERSL
jgi:hypothetical protein